MSIRQPLQKTINTTDFQDRSYSFSAESVVEAEASPGQLVISVSAGYLLTTSLRNQPGREQTFEHRKQSDGSWTACGTVTVLLGDETPVNGTIVVRNSLNESVEMTIAATSEALERSPMPALAISQPSLTFAPTAPGKPSFLIFTLAQPYTGAPVTLTTDAPNYFQFASDSRPNFGPTLTLTTSSAGTHVHVRYMADRRGLHTGQLLIDSAFEHRIVALTGRSKGLLPVRLDATNQSTRWRVWGALLALVVVGGLSFASYSNRYQLFSALLQNTGIHKAATQANDPLSFTNVNVVSTKDGVIKPKRVQKSPEKGAQSPARLLAKRSTTTAPMSTPVSEQQTEADSRSVVPASGIRETATDQSLANTVAERPAQKAIATPPTQESELEKVLNQAPPN